LEPIVKELHDQNVTLYSTGGTEKYIKDLGIKVIPVEEITSYPSILGGRVKTLHPKVFGGILNRQHNQSDVTELVDFDIPQIDLVIVDLYPFEKTVSSGASHEDIIEKIDIGGISLIRAAAKNYADVICVSSVEDYNEFQELLTSKKGITSEVDRKRFAAKAFNMSSHYDTAIFNYFNKNHEEAVLKISETKGNVLRYGENPHQKGFFFGDFDAMFTKLHGKELSYNNLLDVDAAVNLMNEFKGEAPTFAILKHNNACGIAQRHTIHQAYVDALAGDPVSAFGGILISNTEIDKATAEEIHGLFCEVVIAPSFSEDALEILKGKKNRMLLVLNDVELPQTTVRTCLNGVLVQDKDKITDTVSNLIDATNNKPTKNELEDLMFASKICKHTKSNTIVLAKNKQLCASGTGQTSRVDALNQAIHKALSFNFDLKGAVMASDAFFPFPDCVEIASQAGITAVIQPGGSIKDQLSIDYCNAHNVAMVFTGTRHFKH
jgi:phosphoribosylaminoimidazolecarboxamide formyltransferase/IMP cyclohydrolase